MDNVMMVLLGTLCMLLICSSSVQALEEPVPEIYLQPRNFNPHPYNVDDTRTIQSPRGPILFPPSPPPDTEGSNFIKIDDTRKTPHPVDSHPYPKLVRKHKYRNPGRHQEFDNQISPQISRALTGHAKKVLKHSRYAHPDDLIEQKNYAFSYKVVDHLTGDDFSHTQSQNDRATSGEYRVKLPDGRVQIVSYTADKNGYKADVKYQDVGTEPQHRNDIPDKGGRFGSFASTEYGGGNVGKYVFDHRGVAVKASAATPIEENHIEDYDYGQRNEKAVYATPSTPLYIAVTQPTYQDYQQQTTYHQDSQYPDYGDETLQRNPHPQQVQHQIPHRFQIIPHNKVQIVNQGAPTLSTTPAPSYLENPGIILSTPSPVFSGDYPHVFVKSLNGVYGKK